MPFPGWKGSYFNEPFYYVALFASVIAIFTSWTIRRSKFGLGLMAIRADEDRARSLGVHTKSTKLFAFDPTFDLAMAVMAFTGGLGTVAGPVIGALVIESAQQYFLLEFGGANVFLIVYGALFVIILRFLPDGIVPSISMRWRSWYDARERRRLDAVTSNPPPGRDTVPVTGGRA